MTHDPLCARTPTGVHYVGTCTCNLIAKVRADQTKRDIERAEVGLMGCLTTTRDRVIGMIQEAS